MLFRHTVANNGASFAFHAITYASETLDLLFAGVKGRRSLCHDGKRFLTARDYTGPDVLSVSPGVNHRLGKGMRSFLGQVMTDAPFDQTVGVLARVLLGIGRRLWVRGTICIALKGRSE